MLINSLLKLIIKLINFIFQNVILLYILFAITYNKQSNCAIIFEFIKQYTKS